MNPSSTQATGDVCETILIEYLLRKNLWVFTPFSGQGPVDVIAISPDGKVYLFDAKADRARWLKNRATQPHRIYRKRSALQKLLRVRIAYVNEDERTVHFVPSLELDNVQDSDKTD